MTPFSWRRWTLNAASQEGVWLWYYLQIKSPPSKHSTYNLCKDDKAKHTTQINEWFLMCHFIVHKHHTRPLGVTCHTGITDFFGGFVWILSIFTLRGSVILGLESSQWINSTGVEDGLYYSDTAQPRAKVPTNYVMTLAASHVCEHLIHKRTDTYKEKKRQSSLQV